MKFSYNWISSMVSGLPAPKKLAELITLKSFEVESIKKTGNDYVLEIDILPNRIADCAGHEGVAREVSVILNKKVKYRDLRIKEKNINVTDIIKVSVSEKKLCSVYSAKVIEGIKISSSPKYIQEALKSCGVNPVNNVVDAANYIMLETGQPLHVFDADKIEGQEIIVKYAKKGEKIVTLDNETFVMDEKMLTISDRLGIVAIAGIKGGKRAAVNKDTKKIILESANFYGPNIKETSKKLNLSTDASLRFSGGLNNQMAVYSIEKLASLITEISGGRSYKGTIVSGRVEKNKKNILFNLDNSASLLGVKFERRRIIKTLEGLGFKVSRKSGKGESYIVSPPRFRSDINNEADIIEEVGRIIGYDKIPSVLPLVHLARPHKNTEVFLTEKLRDAMQGLGFSEVMNYIYEDKKYIETFGIRTGYLIELRNPIRSENSFLRDSLIGGMLFNAKENLSRTNTVYIFELGRVFKKTGRKNKEVQHFSAVIAKKASKRDSGEDIFFEAKGIISSILESLGISEYWFKNINNSTLIKWPISAGGQMHPFRNSSIYSRNEFLGILYEIHPGVLDDLGITGRVVAFEFYLPALIKFILSEKEFRPISKYPSIVRDISILIPPGVTVERVLNVIERVGSKMLVSTDLFDYYDGAETGEERKSLGFHLVFQSQEKTLTDKEVDKIFKKIIISLEEGGDWEVRK